MSANTFDAAKSQERCNVYRKQILDMSQKVAALHIAPAFSCLEITDVIYHGLMRRDAQGGSLDQFVMSKGHGCLSQYVILADLGILSADDIERYCTPEGRLGGHPDYGVPGIEASTGSLGHGLAMAAGMAHANRLRGQDGRIYCLVGDGEMQEGSSWEAVMMAPNLGLENLVVFLDFNDFQGLGRTTETHPNFLPMTDKVESFGWEAAEVDGHDSDAVFAAIDGREGGRPLFVVCHTIKGKGVSYMENVPIWHYRSPSPEEYVQAMSELGFAADTA
jgi:transketolase